MDISRYEILNLDSRKIILEKENDLPYL